MCNEGCLLHVFMSHIDLVVARETIHEREDFVLHDVVNQNINVKREVVLGACPVQVSVLYTHSYLIVLFWHRKDVSNPLRIGGDSQ